MRYDEQFALHFSSMKAPLIEMIEYLIFSLKSGRSLQNSLQSYSGIEKETYETYLQSHSSKQEFTPLSFEFRLIIQQGLRGFPIISALEELHLKSYRTLENKIDAHAKKAPFYALAPLFLFQVPSLALLFFYPLLSQLLKELS